MVYYNTMDSNNTVVMCMKCHHTFMTKAIQPRCSKCRSTIVKNVESIPKLYGVKDIVKLRIEFETHKKETLEVNNLLLDRIEALENPQ